MARYSDGGKRLAADHLLSKGPCAPFVLHSYFEGSRFQILGNLYCQNEISGNAMFIVFN